MSAVVCGKRSFFDELSSPNVSKRIRCSSSPVRISPKLLDQLISLFPDIDKKLLARVLEECSDDLQLAIKSVNELRLGCANNDMGADASQPNGPSAATNQKEVAVDQQQSASSEDSVASGNLPKDGAGWVELFVKEMMSANHLDDARARAARALDSLEKSLCARASAEAVQNFQQENTMLKEQLPILSHENTILKRAVSIQHERQKEFEDKLLELQHHKQQISQYQERLRTLEVKNYALSMHLKQAQQSCSIPGGFHPDIF